MTRIFDTIALGVALAFYWSLFALFLFPDDLLSGLPVLYSESLFDVIFIAVAAVVVAAFLIMGGRFPRIVGSRPQILAALFGLMLATVIGPLLYLAAGSPVPVLFGWVFPVVLPAYSLCLSIELAMRMAKRPASQRMFLTAASLLASFILGSLLPRLENLVGLTITDSSYGMLLISGFIVLAFLRDPAEADSNSEDASEGVLAAAALSTLGASPSNTLQESSLHRRATRGPSPSIILMAALFFFLMGGAFILGAHSSSVGGLWLAEDWIHNALGALLYLLFCLGAVVVLRLEDQNDVAGGASTKNATAEGAIARHPWLTARRILTALRGPYPWILFFFICLGVMFLSILFYPASSGLCKELVLPMRLLAMVLLWTCAVSAAVEYGRSTAWALVVAAVSMIQISNFLIEWIANLAQSMDGFDLILRGMLLLVSLALMACMVLWLITIQRDKLQAAVDDGQAWRLGPDVMFEPGASVDAGASVVDASQFMAATYGLSERETQVMALIAQGNTQKKIAQTLCISMSSVQTHAKSLYRKLDIHSKQELVDLVADCQSIRQSR
ncbi:MAG: LuxR C-terminal-related transcriptional regulator [Eggerthellales bacterium]|nr:LuxR C-terminal-related transcriptional regulator [Eggerthellales bacterium]